MSQKLVALLPYRCTECDHRGAVRRTEVVVSKLSVRSVPGAASIDHLVKGGRCRKCGGTKLTTPRAP